MSLIIRLKGLKTNKNLIRHQILKDILFYNLANSIPPDTSFHSIDTIASLRWGQVKRRNAINYLLAKGDLTTPDKGIVRHISISDQGLKNFYADYYYEKGNQQVGNFWRNLINIFLSIVVATAAVIALNDNDAKLHEEAIRRIELQLQHVTDRLDTIGQRLVPIRLTPGDTLSNRKTSAF